MLNQNTYLTKSEPVCAPTCIAPMAISVPVDACVCLVSVRVYVLTSWWCRALYWCSTKGAARVEFRSITMHAIPSDPDVHPKPCIYCQLDGEGALDVGDDDDVTSNEILLIPTDSNQGPRALYKYHNNLYRHHDADACISVAAKLSCARTITSDSV
jgi:hypothetical protein